MTNKETKLKALSSSYIVPNFEAVRKFEHHKLLSVQATSGPLPFSKKSSLPPIKNPEVSHESLIYPSLQISTKVLRKNRFTYNEMMNELNKLEAESVRNSYRSVIENKGKLAYYKIRCKQVTPVNRKLS